MVRVVTIQAFVVPLSCARQLESAMDSAEITLPRREID